MAAGPAVAPYNEPHLKTLEGEQLPLRAHPDMNPATTVTDITPKKFALRSIPLIGMAGVLAAAISLPLDAALGAAFVCLELALGAASVIAWTRNIPK